MSLRFAGKLVLIAGGARGLGRTVSLAGTGVRVNWILPSIIDTAANRKAMPNVDFAKWPKSEEIARVILFLCRDDAKVSWRSHSGLWG